jgi:hypothetical protein
MVRVNHEAYYKIILKNYNNNPDWYLWSMGVPNELGPQGHFTQGSAHVLLASSQYLILAQWSSTSHSRIGTQIPTASHVISGYPATKMFERQIKMPCY